MESTSIKIAGDQFDEAIIKLYPPQAQRPHRRAHCGGAEDERSAACSPVRGGAVHRDQGPLPDDRPAEVFTVTSSEMIEGLWGARHPHSGGHPRCAGAHAPELVADIATNGIVMTGGGSLLWGFDKLIESHRHRDLCGGRRHLLRGLRHRQEPGDHRRHAGRHHQPVPPQSR